MTRTSQLEFFFPQRTRHALLITAVTLALSLLVSCSDTVSEEQVEFTQGVITFMEEVTPEQYKIVDEQIVDNKEDSKIITQYIDGHRDTMTLYEAQVVNQDTTTQQRRYYHRTYYGGLMGYYLGRSHSVPPSPGVYQDPSTYNRVQNSTGSTLQRTARRTMVSRPSKSSSGFGSSSKSSRSYGG
ncbi:MAG: hypothetical protein R2824_11195 [Saprospiraceae bacterium]|nr:hypothetical protein [Lewinella sp.]